MKKKAMKLKMADSLINIGDMVFMMDNYMSSHSINLVH